MIIDFGKATSIENAKYYWLNDIEKVEYTRCYSHTASEVIEGITKQTKKSDIYAAGGIFTNKWYKIVS